MIRHRLTQSHSTQDVLCSACFQAVHSARAFYEERTWGLAEQLGGTQLPLIHYQLSAESQTVGEEAFNTYDLRASRSLQVLKLLKLQ